jgi:hypothetical protein
MLWHICIEVHTTAVIATDCAACSAGSYAYVLCTIRWTRKPESNTVFALLLLLLLPCQLQAACPSVSLTTRTGMRPGQ